MVRPQISARLELIRNAIETGVIMPGDGSAVGADKLQDLEKFGLVEHLIKASYALRLALEVIEEQNEHINNTTPAEPTFAPPF